MFAQASPEPLSDRAVPPAPPVAPGASGAAAAPRPLFRRPRREDAVELARQTILAGERLDMQLLATRLGVARTTLYRWVGSREALLEEVLGQITVELFAPIEMQAAGNGVERLLSVLRPILDASVGFEPARAFASREPDVAIRLLLGEGGAVHSRAAELILRLLGPARSPAHQLALEELSDTIVQVATALLWVTFAIGEEPQTDRAMRVVGALLESARGEDLLQSGPRQSVRRSR
jgi:AcrR family transcriptional regulator